MTAERSLPIGDVHFKCRAAPQCQCTATAMQACAFNASHVFKGGVPYSLNALIIHRTLGAFLALQIAIWMVHLAVRPDQHGHPPAASPSAPAARWGCKVPPLLWVKRRAAVHVATGVASCASSLYLLVSLFIVFNPSRLADVRWFVLHDVVQMQHVAIAACMLGSGLSSAFVGLARSRQAVWYLLWMLTNAMIGIVFLVHPEHTREQTVLHQFLGLCLTLAPALFTQALANNFTVEWDAGLAGGMFAVAALLLGVVYKREHNEHVPLLFTCHPSYALTLCAISLGLLASACAGIALLWLLVRHRTGRRAGQGFERLPPEAEVACIEL